MLALAYWYSPPLPWSVLTRTHESGDLLLSLNGMKGESPVTMIDCLSSDVRDSRRLQLSFTEALWSVVVLMLG